MKSFHHGLLLLKDDTSEFYQRDIWQVNELGFKPDTVHLTYQFNFSRLKPTWFKQAVKQFVHFQSATKSLESCRSYIGRLNYFGEFLVENYASILPNQIDRTVIVKYLSFLSKSNLSIVTRKMALIHLKTFHNIIIQEKWLPWPKELLIYSSDFPKSIELVPKYIPEYVVSQLQTKLHHLPEYMQHVITILLETGRRIGEICTLPLNCLERDDQADFYLKVNDKKLKKTYLIPVSESCVNAIQAQQNLINQGLFNNKLYLFAAKIKLKSPHISARSINHALTRIAYNHKIVDENGNIWQFHSHQFRHTVGTRMINAGVPQTIVQKYLGHESPEMTARYAHIHDATLKSAFNDYQGKLVNVKGEKTSRTFKEGYDEAKWLQYNVMSQALPNGLCALPSPQQRCPHANACLTCVNFRTHKKFLPQHNNQLEITNKIIETAKSNGWQRQVEMNNIVKSNLEKIINKLSEEK